MSRLRTLLIVLCSVATTLLVSNLMSPIFAQAAGPGYVSIVGPAFQPSSPSADFEYFFMQIRTHTGTVAYFAPVSLPQGATINEMTLIGYDDDPSNTLQVRLIRFPNGPGLTEQVAILNSTGANGYFQLSAAPDSSLSVVDNETYGYFLELVLPAPSAGDKGITLTRVRMGYDFSQHLPFVKRDAP